ncbi:BON1-associated protein 2-like [Salvia miltiorrhiza]|uniref:BON1-associated protein 2-like n=1 Tax=Salvia miltiorrhiza TaxID=226208 RepID=UPI0025AD2145|nr:BON1-associated protein 2-like [Salvia miltiorrhiza]
MSDVNRRRRAAAAAEEELREIEVLIYSAEDLKNVKHVTKMRTFAEVYVERSVHVARTRVDEHGGAAPVWNEVVKVRFRRGLPERDVMAALNVDVYAHSHLGLERAVGSARVLLCDALSGGDAADPLDNPIQCLTLRVWRESGRPQGWLNLWVPPTGRFLSRRESLSFSVRERAAAAAEEAEEEEKRVGDD